MNKIEVEVLQQPGADPVSMASFAARLTQQKIKNMHELKLLFAKKGSPKLVGSVQEMMHESVTRHTGWTVAVVGASRRFLAQIRTHSIGVDFTSASLQYQNMGDSFDAVVPYKVFQKCEEVQSIDPLIIFKTFCRQSFDNYEAVVDLFEDHDTAGYVSCNGSRNVILITANTEAWRNIIEKRSCNRNTEETQYVTFLMWKTLLEQPGGKFMFGSAGPECIQTGGCRQLHMSCAEPLIYNSNGLDMVNKFIEAKWPLLKKGW